MLVPLVRPYFTYLFQNVMDPCSCSLYRTLCARVIGRSKSMDALSHLHLSAPAVSDHRGGEVFTPSPRLDTGIP